jgi:pilus assembly protein CpaB
MKNSRAIVMLLVAVALGALAVVLSARWLGQQGDLMTNKVVTAARDIQLGTELTPDMLTLSDWPIGNTPVGAFKDIAALQARVVKTSMQRGEPLLENKLAPVGSKGGLSAVIAEGKRAITVKVNEVIGVAGFALPGSHVDIMVNTEDEQERMISKIVLERILVLAVAQEASRDDTKPKVVNAVTLEVTPEEAEKIDLARSIGNLSLVLRNQVDEEDTKTLGIRKRELLGETAPAYVKPAATARRPAARPQPVVTALPADIQDNARVEVIKGLSRSEVEFQNP